MFFPIERNLMKLAALACALTLAVPRAALALESSWTEASHAQVRLLADSGNDGPRAGVEIRLEKGWHTYWRYPGDAGVPPKFDWSASENLASAQVEWPAPEKIVDESGMKSIGYHDHVAFPVAIKPADPGLPIKLRLKLDFAVCEKLCVPAEAVMELEIPVESSDLSEILEKAESRIPRRVMLGQNSDKPGALSVTNIRIEHSAKPRAIISVSAPEGSAPRLFAEGPNDKWALPVPEKVGTSDGLTQFALPFEGAPPGAKPIPPKLTVTLAADDDAIEVAIPLE
ncbi:MAG TPA: protein-disulfide reductase DsbD domain-containing protein [Xanthobacteraceae bacterium]|nr:protein-disulfide reductase DsbD domain-containing protein [Xanthobacteraceae bacterium]